MTQERGTGKGPRNQGVHVPRYVGATLQASGISNTLRAMGNARSERISPKNRKDTRRTAGFKVFTFAEDAVQVKYDLGNRHGLTTEADRAEEVAKHLDKYKAELVDRFAVTKVGEGTDAYLLIRKYPDKKVGEALRKAAERMDDRGDHGAATRLIAWAQMADKGEDW